MSPGCQQEAVTSPAELSNPDKVAQTWARRSGTLTINFHLLRALLQHDALGWCHALMSDLEVPHCSGQKHAWSPQAQPWHPAGRACPRQRSSAAQSRAAQTAGLEPCADGRRASSAPQSQGSSRRCWEGAVWIHLHPAGAVTGRLHLPELHVPSHEGQMAPAGRWRS